MRLVPFVVALGLALARPAFAEEKPGKSFKGQVPPELTAVEWIQGKPIEGLRDLRGKVVLLHFFGTGCGHCQGAAPQLEKLHQDNAAKGLVILGIAADPKARLDAFVKEKGLKYPVVSSLATTTAYGIRHLNMYYVIDVMGRVATEKLHLPVTPEVLDPILAPLLADVAPTEGGRPLDAARRWIGLGQWGAAWEACAKLEKDATEGENAKKLKAWLEARGEKAIAQAEAAKDEGRLMDAIDGWQEVEKLWRGSVQQAAKAKLEALKKDKDGKLAFKVRPTWEKAREAEQKGDRKAAAELYGKVAEQAKGTKTGELAAERARALR